jgi:hypothetical protein
LNLWQPSHGNLVAQATGCYGRLRAEAALEGVAQALVLGQGSLGPTREGVQAYEGGVRLLQGGLFGGRLSQSLDGQGVLPARFVEPRELGDEREVELPELVAFALCPLLVSVLG